MDRLKVDEYKEFSEEDEALSKEDLIKVIEEMELDHAKTYRDIPAKFDAWDIEEDLYEVENVLPAPDKVEVIEEGPIRATLRQVRYFGDSEIVQDVMIYKDSKRIDFDTWVDWHERDTFLKTRFPIDVHINEATFEVQYGNIERPTHKNTSWDRARFEVPHQKWFFGKHCFIHMLF